MSTDPTGGPKSRILIVDDTSVNLDLLARILTERGYAVRTALDGATALRLVESAPPDLILLDIMMPGMDGFISKILWEWPWRRGRPTCLPYVSALRVCPGPYGTQVRPYERRAERHGQSQ